MNTLLFVETQYTIKHNIVASCSFVRRLGLSISLFSDRSRPSQVEVIAPCSAQVSRECKKEPTRRD